MGILARVDAGIVSTCDASCVAKDKLAGETTCASVFPNPAGLNNLVTQNKTLRGYLGVLFWQVKFSSE
jgi:hypothetical protein